MKASMSMAKCSKLISANCYVTLIEGLHSSSSSKWSLWMVTIYIYKLTNFLSMWPTLPGDTIAGSSPTKVQDKRGPSFYLWQLLDFHLSRFSFECKWVRLAWKGSQYCPQESILLSSHKSNKILYKFIIFGH